MAYAATKHTFKKNKTIENFSWFFLRMQEVFEEDSSFGVVSSAASFFDPGVHVSSLQSRVRRSAPEAEDAEALLECVAMSVVARGQR
jgi:hypothetical protein